MSLEVIHDKGQLVFAEPFETGRTEADAGLKHSLHFLLARNAADKAESSPSSRPQDNYQIRNCGIETNALCEGAQVTVSSFGFRQGGG